MNNIRQIKPLQAIGKSVVRKPIFEPDSQQMKNYKKLIWDLFNHFKPNGFIIDDSNKEIIYTVLLYFIKHPDFNKYGLIKNIANLDKGLLIYGGCGAGKTMLFDIIHRIGKYLNNFNNTDFWFPIISCGSFIEDYRYSIDHPQESFSLNSYKRGKLLIDDLGFEKPVFKKEIMGEVIFERHRNKALTIVTTNLTPRKISDRYGYRIGDRLPEMFNIINMERVSLRG